MKHRHAYTSSPLTVALRTVLLAHQASATEDMHNKQVSVHIDQNDVIDVVINSLQPFLTQVLPADKKHMHLKVTDHFLLVSHDGCVL